MRRRFAQVDVFTASRYHGNPVAVVLDGNGIDDATMQRFAAWTNLSETTFVLPPTQEAAEQGAHYRVRIFTASEELPFAGHPMIGTCHAWLHAAPNGANRIRPKDDVLAECGAGLVRIRQDGGRLAFAAPPLRRSGPVAPDLLDRISTALGIGPDDVLDAAWADNGPPWIAVRLRDAAAVLALEPGPLHDLYVGVVGPHAVPGGVGPGGVGPGGVGPDGGGTSGDGAAVEVRAFFPAGGMTGEDPVTGSLNAALAPWLADAGVVVFPYVAAQGTALGRSGRVHLDRDAGATVWVGGDAVTCIEGTVEL